MPAEGRLPAELTGGLAGRLGADLLHPRLGCVSENPACDLRVAVAQEATAKAPLIQLHSQGKVLFLSGNEY